MAGCICLADKDDLTFLNAIYDANQHFDLCCTSLDVQASAGDNFFTNNRNRIIAGADLFRSIGVYILRIG